MLQKIIGRVTRIVTFDQTVYGEIEHDENANVEAAIVVVVSSLLGAIGRLIANRYIGNALVAFVLGILLSWLLWSWVTMFVGTRLFQGEATFWEMARTIGYANVAQAVGLLAWVPCVGVVAGLAGFVLALVFGFFAVREALDIPTEKAILTIVIGWAVVLVINIVLGVIGFGGMFALTR